MNQNLEHLRLLSIFHYVVASLAALFACIPVFHLIFGLVMLIAPGAFAAGNVTARRTIPPFCGWSVRA